MTMPSVPQAKLDDLESHVEAAKAEAREERKRKEVVQQRERQYDAILDKIVRAAHGLPLIEDRNGGYNRNYMGMSVSDGHRCQPPTAEEIQAVEIRNLNERIVGLESRLAAVVAVATFAKEHKS